MIKCKYQTKGGTPMNQMTLTDMEYSNRKKKTKREEFLDAMDEIIPWSYWVEIIRPYYFNNKRGRKPIDTRVCWGLITGGSQSFGTVWAWNGPD